VDDENAVLAFERNYKTQEVIVVINNSKTDQQISLNVKKINIYKDIWNGDTIYKPVDGKFQINLSAKRGAILIPSED